MSGVGLSLPPGPCPQHQKYIIVVVHTMNSILRLVLLGPGYPVTGIVLNKLNPRPEYSYYRQLTRMASGLHFDQRRLSFIGCGGGSSTPD